MTTTATASRVGGERAQVREQRVAEVAERRLDDLERQADSRALPVARIARASAVVEREEDGAGVVEPERPRVVQRAERRGVHARDEDRRQTSAVGSVGASAPRRAGTSVTTTPGSRSSRSLSEKVVRRADRRDERAPAEELRHDHGDELATRRAGARQTYSSTASTRPSLVAAARSRRGSPSTQLEASARIPGSLPGHGTWIAWNGRPRSAARTRAPRSVAASSRRRRGRRSFVARRRRERPRGAGGAEPPRRPSGSGGGWRRKQHDHERDRDGDQPRALARTSSRSRSRVDDAGRRRAEAVDSALRRQPRSRVRSQ